jgi:endonuclease/exonuclease/phosphatase family metal-dependent hydrolase
VVDLERAAKIIRELKPDLVALQEIDNAVERTSRVDQAHRLGQLTGMNYYFGEFMPYQGGHYGMAVLSKYPFEATENHRLPDGAEPRSAAAVRVRIPGTNDAIAFAGIHFYRTEEERLRQAEALLDIFREESGPVILAGDFNSTPDSPVMTLLGQSFTIPDKGEDHFTFHAQKPVREIDFIIYRPADRFEVIESRVIDEALVSDHRPVLLVLELKRK